MKNLLLIVVLSWIPAVALVLWMGHHYHLPVWGPLLESTLTAPMASVVVWFGQEVKRRDRARRR